MKVLGDIKIIRDGAAASLPPSRKTRALLGYLALSRRSHRREELCDLFWEVPDDPRGSLRWSLSKIRPLVDEPALPRLAADRQHVELRTGDLTIDFFAAQACLSADDPGIDDLASAAALFRGPLLADVDLPEQGEFHSWLLGQREDARQLHAKTLRILTERLGATAPEEALGHARELVRIEPLDEAAWVQLIAILADTGRGTEARQQYEAGQRAMREVGGGSGAMLQAWRTVQAAASTRPARPALASRAGPTQPASIMVLPFANFSDDPEQQYFADGITGNLTTDLLRIPDLLVISRNTAFTYGNKPFDTKQIARELAVRYLLEGDVQRLGNQVRVTAQLIDAESDVHLWAERFVGDSDDLFALQDHITSQIAASLDMELVEAEASRPIDRPDTRDYIFRGRATRLRPPTRENRAEAIRQFEEALALDSQSAAAQSWLAIALTARVLDFMAETASADIAHAAQLAEQALAKWPRSPVAHFAQAQVWRAQHRYREAAGEYEMVIEMNRNWAHSYSHLGWCRFMTGLLDELIPAQQRAIRLSPRDPQIGLFYCRIGSGNLLQSRVEEAIAWYERARNATPGHPQFRTFLAASYALVGDAERAAAELAQARRLVSDDRYASTANVRAITCWGNATISALAEETYFAGLRKAGMPED
jgi:TolB-like protein